MLAARRLTRQPIAAHGQRKIREIRAKVRGIRVKMATYPLPTLGTSPWAMLTARLRATARTRSESSANTT